MSFGNDKKLIILAKTIVCQKSKQSLLVTLAAPLLLNGRVNAMLVENGIP
jgi:hypothetical protein